MTVTASIRSRDLDLLMRSVDLLGLLGWEDKRPEANIDGGEYAGSCPRCGGRDRFRVWPYSNRPHFWCRGCGWQGRAVDVVMELHGVGFAEALGLLSGSSLSGLSRPPVAAPMPALRVAGPHPGALSLWDQSVSLRGTIGERYLRGRALTLDLPASLRFHHDAWHGSAERGFPAIVARVDREGEGHVAVHRTYLGPDARKIPTDAKRMLGSVLGAAVRLAPAGETLAISEGVETGLSVQQETGIPTWAALSCVGFDSLLLPALPLASSVVIAADNDASSPVEPGRRAPVPPIEHAYRAAERWTAEGRAVRVVMPPAPGDDFNDLLMRGSR